MKIEIKNIFPILKGLKRKFLQNSLLLLIFFLLIDLIIGGIFFWKYYRKVIGEEPKITPSLKIDQTLLSRFSNTYQKRQELFEEAKEKVYFDIFKPLSSSE